MPQVKLEKYKQRVPVDGRSYYTTHPTSCVNTITIPSITVEMKPGVYFYEFERERYQYHHEGD